MVGGRWSGGAILSPGDIILIAIPLVFLGLVWLVVELTEPSDAGRRVVPPPHPEPVAADEPVSVAGGEPLGSPAAVPSQPLRSGLGPQGGRRSGGRK